MTAVQGWMESEGVAWGCQGGGVCILRIADLCLDVALPSHGASSAPEGSLLLWFGGDGGLIRP